MKRIWQSSIRSLRATAFVTRWMDGGLTAHRRSERGRWRNIIDPDIVITDLLLRDGTGVDVVKRIRERHGPERPVIFVLTNRPNSTHRATLAAAGANGVFDKAHEYGLMLDEVRHVA